MASMLLDSSLGQAHKNGTFAELESTVLQVLHVTRFLKCFCEKIVFAL
jgi:hypothetical protein